MKGAQGKRPMFAGMAVPEGLHKRHFVFLYINTLIVGLFVAFPAILQPAFLKDVIRINQDHAGTIGSHLQNMSQIDTLNAVSLG